MTRPSLLLVALAALGCSDSSEATAPIGDGTRDATDGRGGAVASGGTNAGGKDAGGKDAGAAGAGGSSGAPDASPDARDATVTDAGGHDAETGIDAGSDVVHGPLGPGALVAYDIRSTEKALHVLDPETGRSRSSEPFGTVRAILHDAGVGGTAERWYVFEQPSTADLGVTVHVRHLDDASASFQELGALSGLPLSFGRPATFGNAGSAFVAYLSDGAPGSPAGQLSLTVIDVTDPANPKVVSAPQDALPSGGKLGLVGGQDSLGLIVAQAPPCPMTAAGTRACKVSLAPVTVTASAVSVGTPIMLGETGAEGNAGFVSDPLGHLDLVGFPALSTPTKPACGSNSRSTGKVRRFSADGLVSGAEVSIPIEASRFSGAALDACRDVAFLTTLADDVAIWAVPLGTSGSVTKLCTPTSGGELVYEPSTTSLYRALSTGGIEAYRVDMTNDSPALAPRTLTELPSGFQVGALAVRTENRCP